VSGGDPHTQRNNCTPRSPWRLRVLPSLRERIEICRSDRALFGSCGAGALPECVLQRKSLGAQIRRTGTAPLRLECAGRRRGKQEGRRGRSLARHQQLSDVRSPIANHLVASRTVCASLLTAKLRCLPVPVALEHVPASPTPASWFRLMACWLAPEDGDGKGGSDCDTKRHALIVRGSMPQSRDAARHVCPKSGHYHPDVSGTRRLALRGTLDALAPSPAGWEGTSAADGTSPALPERGRDQRPRRGQH
jgi:hypothetical protein